MVNLKVAKLCPAKRASPRKPSAKARLRDRSGVLLDVFTIDAKSPTFESDLTEVFQRNVAAARRENVRLFGSPDGIVKIGTRARSKLHASGKRR